jgi:hypothetical protein
LDFKQKQSNIEEAREARKQADEARKQAAETAMQGKYLFLFTLVTVVFVGL